MNPTVSVVMPVYNGAAYIEQAARSVLEQTHRILELIVVNDGSTDDTEEIIRAMTDDRIRVLRLNHEGAMAARVAGIRACRGDFVAFCDSDDRWLPEKLERQLERMDGFDLVHADGHLFDGEKIVGGYWRTRKVRPVSGSKEMLAAFFDRNQVLTSSVVARRETLIKALDVQLDRRVCLDLDYPVWLRILEQGGRITFVPAPLLYYRVHSGQLTQGGSKNKIYQEFALLTFLRRNPDFVRRHPLLVRKKFVKTYVALALQHARETGDFIEFMRYLAYAVESMVFAHPIFAARLP